MPSNDEEQNIYQGGGGGEEEEEEEEDLDDEDCEEDGDIEEVEEEEDLTIPHPQDEVEEEEEDLDSASPSTFTSSEDNTNKDSSTLVVENLTTGTTVASRASAAAAAPKGSVVDIPSAIADSSLNHKRQRTSEVSPVAAEEKKPFALDDSRRLFQRLWTDEDEIGLLQGFLEHTMQRGSRNSSYHHDTGTFYDQIKTRLQLDFNKNQLVEKLRRLKKKYRNAVSRISSGKELSFKSHHEQVTFEISRKIWGGGGGGVEEGGLVDEEGNNNNYNEDTNNNDNNNTYSVDVNNSDKKVSSSRKRSRKIAGEGSISNFQATSSIPNVIEETVKSCLSPLFKELLYSAINGSCNQGGYGGVALNPLPLNFKGNSMNFSGGEVVDEKWRKQQILELEVYSKRLELVQDQIKSALEDLKSDG